MSRKRNSSTEDLSGIKSIPQSPACRVGPARERRGMPQSELARLAGISRQALFQIESGAAFPRVDTAMRIARALGCAVEDLFGAGESEGQPVILVGSGAREGSRIDLAFLDGRWIAHASDDPDALGAGFPASDGVLESCGCVATPGLGDANIFIAGCDPALEMLGQMVTSLPLGGRCVWVPCGNGIALDLLERGEVHAAGIHFGGTSGRANLRTLQKRGLLAKVRVIHFSRWTQGWMLRPGLAKSFRGAGDLPNGKIRLLNREPGSGCRIELDSALAAAGLDARDVPGYSDIARNHMAVARRIASRMADAGIGCEAVARTFGLDFLPTTEVSFDLVVRSDQCERPIISALLDLLCSRHFARRLAELPGYASDGTGREVA